MKPLAPALILAFLFLTLGMSFGQVEFLLSLEEARILASKGGREVVTKIGDSQGPFRWIGSAEGSEGPIKTREGDEPVIREADLGDTSDKLKADFFVNEKGNGFTIISKFSGGIGELDTRSDQQKRMGPLATKAVYLAIEKKDTVPIEGLLKLGLGINEPINGFGETLLHEACALSDDALVKWLLGKGADPSIKDFLGGVAIESVLRNKSPNLKICELLKVSEEDELISGLPMKLIRKVFFEGGSKEKRPIFISFNGKPATAEFLKLAKECSPDSDIYSRSKMGGQGSYVHKDTKIPGVLYELTLEESKDEVWSHRWVFRGATGSFLAGGGNKGRARKQYGYWISETTMSWVE